MGQANKRGTFEERQLKAQQRNIAFIAEAIKRPRAVTVVDPKGMQRLVTKLVMAGAFPK